MSNDENLFLSSICKDPFWNTTFTLDTSWPRFTHCFKYTVLSWPAPLWLLLLFLAQLVFRNTIRHGLPKRLKPTPLFICRLLGTIFLAALTVAELVINITEGDSKASSYVVLISNILRLSAFLSAALLLILVQRSNQRASGLLFVFWTLQLITEIVMLYQRVMEEMPRRDVQYFVISTIITSLVAIQFVLTFLFEDGGDEVARILESDKKPWPEETSSYPSLLFFVWITSTIHTAWKRTLRDDDMYHLPEHMTCLSLKSIFSTVWRKVYSRDKSEMIAKLTTPEVPVQTFGNMTPGTSDELTIGGGGPSSERRASYFNLAINNSTNNNRPQDNNKPKKDTVVYPMSVVKTLIRIHGLRYSFAFLQKLASDVMLVLQPLLVSELINFVQKPAEERVIWIGVVLCCGFVVIQVTRSCLYNSGIYLSGMSGLQMKSALISAVFQKGMTMSAEAGKQFTAGEMITLMSVDCQRILEVWRIAILMAGAPIQLTVPIIFLFYTVGVSTIAGIVVLLLLFPLFSYLTSRMRKLQGVNMKLKSQRVRLTTDVLSGIKVLKLYAWEESFQEKISAIRQKETNNLRNLTVTRAVLRVSMVLAPYLVTLATFTTYILISADNYLDPATAFVSITYFNIMRAPLILTTFVTNAVVMSVVSLKRINRFLYGEDLEPYVRDKPSPGCAISVSKASFAWDSQGPTTLTRISMDVQENSLTMLVGKVGSGKTSVLSAILGEMRILGGSVDVKGSVAYVAQQAWIQNATVRDNILFGCPFDRKKYRTVLKACALESDLRLLANGDMTVIGEKGINLSGGQKQRIALARAVYSEQDIYILDDPLSAVDSHVGKHIFKYVISDEGLLNGKTRLLVTHGAQWLPHAHKVIMLEEGTITHSGSYHDLIARKSDFIQMLAKQNAEDSDESDDEDKNEEDGDFIEINMDVGDSGDEGFGGEDAVENHTNEIIDTAFGMSGDSSAIALRKLQKSLSIESKDPGDGRIENKLNSEDLTEEETMQSGKVKWKVPYQWVKAGSFAGMMVAILGLALHRATEVGHNFLLSFWTSDRNLANASLRNTSYFQDRNHFFLAIFGSIGVAELACITTGMVAFALCSTLSANRLHKYMLTSTLRSPMSFFDVTPMGRLLNRFAGDVDLMDNIFPTVTADIITCFCQIVGTMTVISINFPYFILALIPINGLFYLLQIFFLPMARQIKRMESVSKSPIYSHFSEAVSGASTIRAYGVVQRFLTEDADKVDFNAIRTLTHYACIGWLTVCLDMLGMLVIVTTSLFVVLSNFSDGAMAGLTISYAMEFSLNLNFFVRQQSEFTANSVAVERILEYSELSPEAKRHSKSSELPPQWPSKGHIEFRDLQLRYRPGLDLVLKGINTVIRPGEKVGIVGRTGAGKSSLTMALFRLVEAAGGAIYIDGVDIAKVGLYQLRSKLSILPQDPVLFNGTLRLNVDPHGEYPDDQVREALSKAHLNDFMASRSKGLDYVVGEEGKNLSVGERQLVCLARALLRRSCVLVLDEATAAVDVETDSLIQETIRTSFKECTVLAIAHRINTILDYDRIMVLDAGHVAEMASPNELLSNPESIFYSLAKEANLVTGDEDNVDTPM